MDIYVQSRGFAQDNDYCWLHIDENGATRLQLPPIGLEVSHLIDNETPSVVLERLSEDQLLLLLTGIEPEGRLDFLDRPIRIAIAWVAPTAQESILRHLAARALTDENALTEAIHQAVPLGGEYGFNISRQSLLKLVSNSPDITLNQAPNLSKKIGNNSSKLRDQLSQELRDYNLPPDQGSLVVVTGIKKRETLEKAGVWRSLSSLIDEMDWSDVPTQTPISPLILAQGADYKNPLVWLRILLALLSYWLELMFKFILSNHNTLPINSKEGKESQLKSTDQEANANRKANSKK